MMKPHIAGITLGVRDVATAKAFYAEGLGWPIAFEQGEWVSFNLNDDAVTVGLLSWDALAGDAGVAPDGNGFRGMTFSYLVGSQERVDELLAEAERAGGSIAKPAQEEQWGGYGGLFADPDGHLWKVVVGNPGQPLSE